MLQVLQVLKVKSTFPKDEERRVLQEVHLIKTGNLMDTTPEKNRKQIGISLANINQSLEHL